MELVLCTLGTRGDLQPFLLMARELSARGFRVTLLSNESWQREAQDIGIAFVPIAPEDTPQDNRDDYRFFKESTLPSFRRSYDYITNRLTRGTPITVIYRSNMLGAQCAAARGGAASIRVVLQPSAVKSVEGPPWPMSGLSARLGRRVGRTVASAIYAAAEWRSPYAPHIRQFRSSLGLPTHVPWREACAQDSAVLMLCPRWFALPQSDWPTNMYLTGFPLPDEWRIEEDLEAFITANGAPLVFTPGTGISNASDFFERAAVTALRMELPAVLLGRNIPQRLREAARIFSADYAPLAGLLRRSKAVFHHGGIGTIAEALRAGCPQIVIPNRFDQPDNAMRIARLGLGGAIMSNKGSGEDWAHLLQTVLNSGHVKSQLNTARQLVAAQSGVANAVGVIQQVVAASALPTTLAV